MTESQRDEAEPFQPALRLQFGLKALTLTLVAVSLTFALSRWLPAAIVVAVAFSCGLVALHVFSTALGRRLRASRPDERAKRQPIDLRAVDSVPMDDSQARPAADGELRERRSVATLASWTAVLVAGACIGAACGWSFIGGDEPRPVVVRAAGLAAFGFLGALAGGLSHALAASLLVAHRQSVQASEAEGPRG